MKENTKHAALMQTVIVGAIIGFIAFFGGMKFQQTRQPAFTRGGNFMMRGQDSGGNRGPGMMRQGFRPVTGEIIKSDETSVTVKLPDGSSRIVLLSQSTQISKAATGTKEDLTVGTTIAAFGSENRDGSVTAQSVQLNPVMRLNRDSQSPAPKQ